MFERHKQINGFINVPFSGGEYKIDCRGTIADNHNKLVPSFTNDNNDLCCKVKSWDGVREYKVALLVALAFKGIRVPVERWNELDVYVVDGNPYNLHPSNLVWKFPEGGLRVPNYPEFAYVPMFSLFAINKQGELIRVSSGIFVEPFGDRKYLKFRLPPDCGPSIMIGRHRLVALAWLPYGPDVDSLVVNHKDGVPGNDVLSNLELVSRSDNNKHARRTGLTSKNKAVLVRNVVTGKTARYSGTSACANALGINRATVSYRINAVDQPIYPGDLQFKYERDKTPWREVTQEEIEKAKTQNLHKGIARPVVVKHFDTQETREYTSAALCAHDLKIPVMTVNAALNEKRRPRPTAGWDFKYADDDRPWPTYTEDERALFRLWVGNVSRFCGLRVIDTQTNEKTIYRNAIELGAKFGISRHSINDLVTKQRLYKDRYLVQSI